MTQLNRTQERAAPPSDLTAVGNRLFSEMLERFIVPEVVRRRGVDEWPEGDGGVYRFQVLLPPDGPVQVRLNEEVGGQAEAIAARPIEAGEDVMVEDIAGIVRYTPPPADADIPHVSAFAHRDGWSLAFQFGYRHPRRLEFLALGRDFSATAHDALAAGRVGAALDAAFSAAELFAKAELLSCAPTIEAALAARTHGSVREPYNLWGRLENTDTRFVKLLNRLEALRAPARYLDGELRLKAGEPDVLFETLREMEAHVANLATGEQQDDGRPGFNVIATRDLRAGELVGSDDFSLRPSKDRPS